MKHKVNPPQHFNVHMVLYTSGAFCNTESFLASNCSKENIIVSLTNPQKPVSFHWLHKYTTLVISRNKRCQDNVLCCPHHIPGQHQGSQWRRQDQNGLAEWPPLQPHLGFWTWITRNVAKHVWQSCVGQRLFCHVFRLHRYLWSAVSLNSH